MHKPTRKIWRKLTCSTQSYKYNPLTEDQIRILVLHPGQFESPLEITLKSYEIYAMDDIYNALSYCWGNPKRHIPIRCNGSILKITTSLEIALRRLRSTEKSRVLWIDAICINQEDEEERAHQVAYMKEIYSKAAQVDIWLGEEDNRTGLAIMAIDKWAAFNRQFRNDSDAIRYSKFEEEFASKPGYCDSLAAVGALTHRQWFNRCWTFQEILLSTRAVLHIGHRNLTWDKFYCAISAFPVHLLVNEVLNFNALFMSYGKARFEESHSKKISISVSRNLSRLMQITRNFIASDPRDKIFSMLSLATLKNPNMFKPEYFLSEQETFIKFTLAMIRDENSLNVLMSTGEEGRDKNLPSWCPDWRCNSGVTLKGYYDYISYAVNDKYCPDFSGLQLNAQDELVLEGAHIDVIQEVYDLEALEQELKDSYKDANLGPVLMKYARKFGLDRRRHRYTIAPEAVLLRTLSADHWFFSNHVQSSYKERWFPTHLRFWDLERNKRRQLKTDNVKAKMTPDTSATFICRDQGQDRLAGCFDYSFESPFTHSVIDKVYRQASPYYVEGQDFNDAKHVDAQTLALISNEVVSQALFFFKKKRILITRQGYVALGNKEARVGDHICTFWGADVPFVIRETRGRGGSRGDSADSPFAIVCECYIDGPMYGELFRTSRKSQRQGQQIQQIQPLHDWLQIRKFKIV